jgi:hypothetical protein
MTSGPVGRYGEENGGEWSVEGQAAKSMEGVWSEFSAGVLRPQSLLVEENEPSEVRSINQRGSRARISKCQERVCCLGSGGVDQRDAVRWGDLNTRT